jgi:predicted nucleic acid-binding protein
MLSERASVVEQAIRHVRLIAPESINPEVLQSIRGIERSGAVGGARAGEMVDDFLSMSLTRMPTFALMADAWSLRSNVSAYDACYVALARELKVELITADRRLARAPGLGIPLIVV